MFCSSQWCFLSFCLTFFLYFFLSFLYALHGSQGLKGMSGMSACILLCFLLVVVVGIFLITPRPLQPAVLLSKYSTLGTEQLHHRCHREHLVITSCAQPPAEFTELSASPMTCLCLCVSLLETLDMLNTPIRPRPSLLHATSPSEISLLRTCICSLHIHTKTNTYCKHFFFCERRASPLHVLARFRAILFVLYCRRSCLSSTTQLFPKASGSKCVDYSSIHLYNACDNGIKQLQWEKSVWRMDYFKALPMGHWTQELSQAVSISSGCSASQKCSNATFNVHISLTGEKTWDGEATVMYVLPFCL